MFANSNTNANNGGSNDYVVYNNVNIPSTGTWYLWGRFYYPGAAGSNEANLFMVRVDAGTLKKFGNNKDYFRKWHWGGDGNQETGIPTAVPLGNLSGGNHSVRIEKREVVSLKPRLDVFCITDDGVNPPTDSEACTMLGGCP